MILMSVEIPVTAAVRFLRQRKVDFVPRLYKYVEKGGTAESAKQLGVDEYAVVKTLVFETNEKKGLIVLMHGDKEVATKNLARHLDVKSVAPVTPDKASKLTGYLVGGTSPFGTKMKLLRMTGCFVVLMFRDISCELETPSLTLKNCNDEHTANHTKRRRGQAPPSSFNRPSISNSDTCDDH